MSNDITEAAQKLQKKVVYEIVALAMRIGQYSEQQGVTSLVWQLEDELVEVILAAGRLVIRVRALTRAIQERNTQEKRQHVIDSVDVERDAPDGPTRT